MLLLHGVYFKFYFALICINLIAPSSTCLPDWHKGTAIPNKCYKLVTNSMSWSDAENYCMNISHISKSHLTSIAHALENADIQSILQICNDFWIGFNDVDKFCHFKWTDGRKFRYRNWDTHEPNSQFPCTALETQSGKWKTSSCTERRCFVCEYFKTDLLNNTAVNTTTTTSTSSSSSTASATSLSITTITIVPADITSSVKEETTRISSIPFVPETSASSSRTMQTETASSTTTATTSKLDYSDCYDWLHIGGATSSGVYIIKPSSSHLPCLVYCDMTTDGGGWTVFQRRIDNSTIFWTRLWGDYKVGFGNGLERNFWLGLDNIHRLTAKDANVTLRIDLRGNRCLHDHSGSNCVVNNAVYFGEWGSFMVDSEADGYRLHISSLTPGNLTNGVDFFLLASNMQPFTTADRDNANWQYGNCASYPTYQSGPWWYNSGFDCGVCSLNGKYDPALHAYARGFSFNALQQRIIPVMSELKLRRN